MTENKKAFSFERVVYEIMWFDSSDKTIGFLFAAALDMASEKGAAGSEGVDQVLYLTERLCCGGEAYDFLPRHKPPCDFLNRKRSGSFVMTSPLISIYPCYPTEKERRREAKELKKKYDKVVEKGKIIESGIAAYGYDTVFDRAFYGLAESRPTRYEILVRSRNYHFSANLTKRLIKKLEGLTAENETDEDRKAFKSECRKVFINSVKREAVKARLKAEGLILVKLSGKENTDKLFDKAEKLEADMRRHGLLFSEVFDKKTTEKLRSLW